MIIENFETFTIIKVNLLQILIFKLSKGSIIGKLIQLKNRSIIITKIDDPQNYL